MLVLTNINVKGICEYFLFFIRMHQKNSESILVHRFTAFVIFKLLS